MSYDTLMQQEYASILQSSEFKLAVTVAVHRAFPHSNGIKQNEKEF